LHTSILVDGLIVRGWDLKMAFISWLQSRRTAPCPKRRFTAAIAISSFSKLLTASPQSSLRLYQDTIPILNKMVVGFDLLGGTQPEQAKKVAELLNGHVLDVFVRGTETGEA
jgi:hypothetical protein